MAEIASEILKTQKFGIPFSKISIARTPMKKQKFGRFWDSPVQTDPKIKIKHQMLLFFRCWVAENSYHHHYHQNKIGKSIRKSYNWTSNSRWDSEDNYRDNEIHVREEEEEEGIDYTSATAKERPVKGRGAFGGGGWGGGRSCKRSTKAPKSSFTALFSFLAINMMHATPNPSNTHMFAAEGEEDGMPLSLLLLLLQRVVDQRKQELR